MSDLSGELCVVASALVSPLAITPAGHAFFAAAGATPAAASPDGPMKGTFACPWIPEGAAAGSRLGVLAAQAIRAILDDLPEGARGKGGVDVVVVCPGEGLSEDDAWLVERSARTAAGAGVEVRAARGGRAWLDELLRAGRELSAETVRILVAVDSRAAPCRAGLGEGAWDSPWDLPPPRRSEAAAGLALATPAGALSGKMAVAGRIRGVVARVAAGTPEDDAPSDGSGLSEAIAALPGRGVFRVVAGPRSVSGFFRDELEMAVARTAGRFAAAYRAVCPAAVLGDAGLAGLPAAAVLGLAMARHGTGRGGEGQEGPGAEETGPVLVWDVLDDGTRLSLSLEASLDFPPAHVAARALSPVRVPPPSERRFPASTKEAREGCLERLTALGRLRGEAPWRELPGIERRILANLDALAEAGATAAEVAAFCGGRGDPAAGFVAALALGTLVEEGAESAARIEEVLVELFGAEGGVLLEEGVASPGPLWGAAEGLFLSPVPLPRGALQRWLDQGPPVAAAAALVVLARRGELDPARGARRGGEPLVAAALARAGVLVPEVGKAGRQAVRDLLEGPGPLAWEAARALLVSGDDTAVARVRSGDGLCDRLGDRALVLLALAGEREDGAVFGRISRRVARSERALWATGLFGDVELAPVLLDALGDRETKAAAERALETMLGPAPGRAGESGEGWREAVSGATWARGGRARDGRPWSVEGIAGAGGGGRLSDRDWAFRVDEIRVHAKRLIAVDPGGFGEAARAAFVAAVERSGR